MYTLNVVYLLYIQTRLFLNKNNITQKYNMKILYFFWIILNSVMIYSMLQLEAKK
jgi:hypothetical protein